MSFLSFPNNPSPVALNVLNFQNARGDGVTDDSAPAQAAINAASTLAGGTGMVTVIFPAGYTFLLGSLTPKSNVQLWCYGATLKLKPSALQAMFFLTAGNLSNFEIRGGNFPGTGIETTAQAILQVNTPGTCQDVNVYDTTVTNWATGPYYFGNCTRARAIDNTIINCCSSTGTNAINFVSQLAGGIAQTCIATGNIVLGNATHCIAYVNTGTTVNTECRVVFTNNICESNASNVGAGIDIEFGTAGIAEGSKFVIADNVVAYTGTGTIGFAISLNGASGTDGSLINRVAVTGNVVDSTTRGILVNASHATCTGNVVTSVQAAMFIGKGVTNPNSYQVIADNVLHTTNAITDPAVLTCNWIQHAKITNNLIITDTVASSTTPDGITVTNGGWIEILENTIIQAPRHGMVISGNDFEIRGNRVYNPSAQGAGFHGIFLNAPTGVVRVHDNVVVDDRGGHQMTNGINVSATPQASITGNYISGYTGSAVIGTVAYRINNRLTSGNANGRATLVAGTVTVNTAEIQTSDNVILTVVVPGGTRGEIQLGTIVAGTSFVINSIQPGTASTIQNLDTSVVYWRIDH